MKKLRIGLVGTGFIAPFHLRGFAQCPEAEVVGLCTHGNQARLQELCREYRVRAFEGFEQLVGDPAVDALVIGSFNPDHGSQILRAIEAGKPVLVEKPVVTSLTELEVIRARSEAAGVAVMPAHNFVYRGAVRDALEVLRRGDLGPVVFASFASNHTISPEHAAGWRGRLALSGGGALMDSGHHQVYQALAFLGRPQKIHAFKSRIVLRQMEGEDVAHVQLLYRDGAVGSILQTWTTNRGGAVDGIRLVGLQGELQVTDALYVNGEKRSPDTGYERSFAHQAQAFVDLVRRGTPPLSTLDDARDALRLIQLAYRSSETGIACDFDPARSETPATPPI